MLDASQQVQVRVRSQAPSPPTPATPPIPEGQHEFHALIAKRSELAAQLEALTERREEVADQLHGAEASARSGLLGRLAVLDERIAQIEREILQADDAIASAAASGVVMPPPVAQTETQVPPQWDMDTFGERAVTLMVAEALVFILLGIVLYKLGWARAKARFSGSQPNDPRIDQLQNSVDAIAVEVERISEGQRYVSKMLNDGTPSEIVARGGQEEAIPARRKAT
ncbi:MAG TPA: hypothetical protein VJ650_16900 [Gemmatimonadaceae bacterium]|nr:hypothetical protein [Gemmatimonadaceae bacterium]